MGGNKIKSLVALFLALFVVVSFQNCSADNFATEGNGQPYEGLTPDVVNRDDGEIEEPGGPGQIGEGNDNTNSANIEPEGDQVVFICRKNNNNSKYFQRIKFGYLESGQAVISFTQNNGDIFHIAWDSSTRFHVANTTLPGNYSFIRAIENQFFSANGKLHLKVNDEDGNKANETFICN